MFCFLIDLIAPAVSAPMCSIASAVLQCNGCPQTAVSVINKYSTALSSTQPDGAGIVADLASPPHIIVTETADAGLLGEYMLPSLLHAAKTLASPLSGDPSRKATFIPASAVVYAALVEGEPLMRMSRANFFSSQLRSDEAYSCGKLPNAASVLTPSFVGKHCMSRLDAFFKAPLRRFFHKLQPCRSCLARILSENGIRFNSFTRTTVLPCGMCLTQCRQPSSATAADLRAVSYCGGQCTLPLAFPSRTPVPPLQLLPSPSCTHNFYC